MRFPAADVAKTAGLRATLLVLALLLAACAGRPPVDALKVSTAPAANARAHTILVATTRAKDERPGALFGRERSDQLHFAATTVTVPPMHEPGEIEWPSTPPGDPDKHFTLRSAAYLDQDAFRATLDRELAKLPDGEREVLVFIHGYNTRFPEALYRMAQLRHDTGLPHVAVLFTWPSGGDITDYLYDNNSATIARDGLEQTLRTIARSRADTVNILAHSMGNWVLTETMRQIEISGRPLPEAKIGLVAMAAPDLDVDVFKAQLRRVNRPSKPYVILVSRDDRALLASSILAGGKQRVGAYDSEEELAELGAIVVDLTDVESHDSANHGKFTQIAQAAPELRALLRSSQLARRPDGEASSAQIAGHQVTSTVKAVAALPIRIIAAPITVLSAR